MPWKRFFIWLGVSLALIVGAVRFAGGDNNKVAFSTRPGPPGQVKLTAMLPVVFYAYVDKGQPEGVLFCQPKNEEAGTLTVGGKLQAIRLYCKGGVQLTVAGVEFDAH